MVHHPGPDREFSLWCKEKKSEWIGVDCGSADHPMLALVPQAQVNTIIRNWMSRQAAEADRVFQEMFGTSLKEQFSGDKYRLAHIERWCV